MREMKNSGIEWIGEIPTDWELSKIGAVYEERNEKVSDVDFQPLSITKQGVVPQLETAAKTNDGENRKLIRKNDFVINSRSDRRGSCGISEYDGSCSLINTVLKPRRNMCNAYYSFVFRSERFADEFYRWGNGIVDDLWSTKWSNMKRIYIPAPSLSEQRRITDYLDRKCSQIDTIIAHQQEVIEKLKAYKLSVITEAVTKGLNPNVPMKDSGVEWIGEIPDFWNVVPLKTCSDILPGYAFSSDDFDTKNGTALLRGINVTPNGIRWEDVVYWNKPITEQLQVFELVAGDIVVGLDRPWVSGGTRVCWVTQKDLPALLLQRVCRIRAKENIDSRWIYHWIASKSFQEALSIETTGVSVPHISTKQIEQFSITLPPIEVQHQICDILEATCGSIDNVVNKKQGIIDKLTEYKKSLIYEVVTGKKEV